MSLDDAMRELRKRNIARRQEKLRPIGSRSRRVLYLRKIGLSAKGICGAMKRRKKMPPRHKRIVDAIERHLQEEG